MRFYVIIVSFLCCQAIFQIGSAQEITVKVISKTIEKEFNLDANESVEIAGEKAKISIQGWDQNKVKVLMKQISKAPSKSVAEKELDYQRYIFEKHKGVVHIKNYFAIPVGVKELESIQKVEYEIWLPRKIKLSLQNNYGNSTLKALSGNISISTKYGNINLDQYNGSAVIKSYFGDLKVNDFRGSLYTESNHTMITLSKVSGDVELHSVLGDVVMSYSPKLSRCKIVASKADVTLNRLDWNLAYINLSSQFGDLLLPIEEEKKLVRHGKSKLEFKKGRKDQASHVDIRTSFGKIIIP